MIEIASNVYCNSSVTPLSHRQRPKNDMNKILIFLFAAAISSSIWAKGGSHSGGSRASNGSGGTHSVRGHATKKGTYVQPHRATNPDGRKSNNWSHKGNVNPNTGKKGTKE
jgi:hypothetical protein